MTERVGDERLANNILDLEDRKRSLLRRTFYGITDEAVSDLALDLRDARQSLAEKDATIATLRQRLANAEQERDKARASWESAVINRNYYAEERKRDAARADKAEAALADAKTAAWVKGRDAAKSAALEHEEGIPIWPDGIEIAQAIAALQPPSPSTTAEPGSEVRT